VVSETVYTAPVNKLALVTPVARAVPLQDALLTLVHSYKLNGPVTVVAVIVIVI
jgi:hypothetical protein